MLAGRIAVLGVMIAGAIFAGRFVESHARTSERFSLTDIEVTGAMRLSEDEILLSAGVMDGQNAFEVGPEEAQSNLERHPWVAEAQVVRRLPNSLDIQVREREAMAILVMDKNYMISAEGEVFKEISEEDPVDLPVVTGVDRTRFTSDTAYRDEILLAVTSLLSDYRLAGLWRRERIAEIHVEPNDTFSLYVNDDATYIRLGQPPFRDKLRRLRRVLERLDRSDDRPLYVYLDNERRPDRVTVKLR